VEQDATTSWPAKQDVNGPQAHWAPPPSRKNSRQQSPPAGASHAKVDVALGSWRHDASHAQKPIGSFAQLASAHWQFSAP